MGAAKLSISSVRNVQRVKKMLLRLLVLDVRDSVITLSAIAYNVNNNLDEVLLAIVCTVYNGNMITRSRLVPTVTFSEC